MSVGLSRGAARAGTLPGASIGDLASRGGATPGRRARRAIVVFVAAALLFAFTERGLAAQGVDVDKEVRLVYRPSAPEPSAGPRKGRRAVLEAATVLLLENAHYWTANSFIEDWQFELTWDDQKKRLLQLEGVRFDSNAFQTNWTHAAAGGSYYTFGRINNLGVKDSLLMATFASLYWEIVVEWREVVSVNDLIVTEFGALSIGEPLYQLSRYLTTRRSPVARALGFVHPVMGLHALLDPASRPRPTEEQTLPGYGVFLSLGAGSVDSRYPSDSGSFTNVGLRSRFALAPGFTSPGAESRSGWEVLSSAMNLAADFDGGTVRELDVFSQAVFYGHLERSVGEDSRGSASILGFGSAFTLFRKAQVADAGETTGERELRSKPTEPRDFRDQYAIMHLFGPVYEGYWRGSSLGLSWAVGAYPDFALVNAYALNAYSADHDIGGVKTTLLEDGYYYGYGASIESRLGGSLGPVTFGAAASLHYHESIEGLDRFEDELDGDVHAKDTWFRVDASLGVPLPGTPLSVEATARWSSRRGAIGDTVVKGSESRYLLGVVYRL